ncbi:hypothetical protein [Actinomadura parmotrematis]|uniref:Uncharacterized protein n=1 Tax=Actinomadura parmotrematis TaxID=2864039 RepID=A0ABS7G164_9ACTN|nr:hypothetical protein [Actinomadura parmotrematis]MBW8486455.1 hypothetical protein [Actinomadura parmotrematis]
MSLDRRELLDRLDTYDDPSPRATAPEGDSGPLSPSVRPAPGAAKPAAGPQDVDRNPGSAAWVAATAASLRAAVEAAGLRIREHPAMVLTPRYPAPGVRGPRLGARRHHPRVRPRRGPPDVHHVRHRHRSRRPH